MADLPFLGKVPEQMFVEAELRRGMRCCGCGARITDGYEFVAMQPVQSPEGTVMGITHSFTCNGVEGCTTAIDAAKEARAVREISWKWLDVLRPGGAEDPAKQAGGESGGSGE